MRNRLSVQANSIVKSLGFKHEAESTISSVGSIVESLLQKGYTNKEVANILRPMLPALKVVVSTLDEVS